jgi:hypothetical protein
MKVVFYDINLINLKRYIHDIVDNLILKNGVEVVLMYDEFDKEGYDFYKNKKCTMIKNTFYTYKSVYEQIETISPNIFMVNAQRLSDSAFISVAKELGIKTGMIQHGMYTGFAKRERFFFIQRVFKTFKYLMYSQVVATAIKMNGFDVFKKYLKTFVKGETYKDVIDFTDMINSDFVLVHGEYWKKYHHEMFGYSYECQHLIGYPEMNKVREIKTRNYEADSVCYIAQTLVEDGRIDREIMEVFFSELETLTKDRKIYIKLHPRSDKSIFENKNFILVDNEIPYCEYYIGHYSSLLALMGQLNSKTVLYELEGHPTPEHFKGFFDVVFDFKSLNGKLFSENSMKNPKKQEMEFYFATGYTTEKAIDFIIKGKEN